MVALPSGGWCEVKSIETFDGALDEAHAPMSVTLTLEDELDISRGDMLASIQKIPEVSRQFDATGVWLNEQALDPSRPYLLKHTTQTAAAVVTAIRHRGHVKNLDLEPAQHLGMN